MLLILKLECVKCKMMQGINAGKEEFSAHIMVKAKHNLAMNKLLHKLLHKLLQAVQLIMCKRNLNRFKAL